MADSKERHRFTEPSQHVVRCAPTESTDPVPPSKVQAQAGADGGQDLGPVRGGVRGGDDRIIHLLSGAGRPMNASQRDAQLSQACSRMDEVHWRRSMRWESRSESGAATQRTASMCLRRG